MAIPKWASERIEKAKRINATRLFLPGRDTMDVYFASLRPPLPPRDYIFEFPSEIYEMTQLIELSMGSNSLSSLSESIGKLHNLSKLNLNGNRFASLPEAFGALQNLKMLGLSHNQFVVLPESLAKLKGLTYLDISYNHLTSLPEWITELESLDELALQGNQLTNPPQEVAEGGISAIREYFRQLREHGQDQLYEAKLLILGEGGAGKTTLAKKIENSNYKLVDDEKTTEGVDIIQWSFPMDGDKSFRVNIWDFGGQEIYHATHQFFLTRRSLYILVADTRKEDTDFYYWLNVADLLSDNSPLLIVKNEKQDRSREISENQLRGQFKNLKEVLSTNLLTNRGLDEVKDEIKHYIKSLPHIGAPLPITWLRVRERLENDPRSYIFLDEYLKICKQNGFAKTKDSLQLSSYLHDIGVFLHFQDDPLLNKTVILKPKWGTNAAYKLLDHKMVIKNLGRFTREDVKLIWNEPVYENMHDELLQLMMRFKLCYEIPDKKNSYIAPQLLTENQPEYKWSGKDNLLMRYSYEFMPKGVLTSFIVVINRYIAIVDGRSLVWKSGVVIAKDRTAGEIIEHYGKREISVRVWGEKKKELMIIIMHELDKIHYTYERLKYDKLIPCNCVECKLIPNPHFYRYDQLLNFVAKHISEVQCGATGKMVNVQGLINDVVSWKSEKDIEDVLDESKKTFVNGIHIGNNFSGTIIYESKIKNSLNKIESADSAKVLKETLKQLVQAVDDMNMFLPEKQASEVADDLGKLVDEVTKDSPRQKWYSVSIDGLTKAAEKLGKVGEPVIKLAMKVLTLLA